MAHYFFDSSALTKRYITEIGSAWVRAISTPAARHSILLAHIAPTEMVSAMMRRVHAGTLPLVIAQQARQTINHEATQHFTVIAFSPTLEQLAQDLLERYQLRSLDAIQLASALDAQAQLSAALQPNLVFVAADQRLLTAASAEGLSTDNPLLHP